MFPDNLVDVSSHFLRIIFRAIYSALKIFGFSILDEFINFIPGSFVNITIIVRFSFNCSPLFHMITIIH